MEKVKEVEVTIQGDNIVHAGKPVKNGDKVKVSHGQAVIMSQMKTIKEDVKNGGK